VPSSVSNLEQLPPLREVIEQHGLQALKALGQNFLLDSNITDKIARAAAQPFGGTLAGVQLFEIGPGPGGLTRSLLKLGADKLRAVEFDDRAVRALQGLVAAADGRLEIIQGDAMKTDLAVYMEAGARYAIVANLPYNIATPLLVGWLGQIYECSDMYQSMTLMFQKEVAERIVAAPGTKAYGRLAVLSQWLCACKKMFDLPPNAFTPPPKVKSSIVQFIPRGDADHKCDFTALERVTAAAFGQRRKMVRSSLKDYLPALEALGIDSSLRAENLTVQNYIDIAAQQK
jgi:16S rRNA (adenine1518-N6/adenine1519-N6)-dimethyltransferase